MSGIRLFRLVLATVIAFLVLRAAPASSSQAVSALAIDPRSPTTIYVGRGGGGVLKSTDGGASWSATALIDIITTSLAIDPQTPTTLYAGDYFGTVYKSTDGGASWSAALLLVLSGSVSCGPCGSVWALAVDPLISTTVFGGTDITTAQFEDGSIWTVSGEVYKSTDGGEAFSPIMYPVENQSVLSLAIAPRTSPETPPTIYAGRYVWINSPGVFKSGGVFKSLDGGATWISTGLADVENVLALAIDPLTPTTLYAGAYRGSVFKSTDGGTNWNAIGLNGDDVSALAIDPLTPTTLYAGTISNGVFKSADGGVSWNATDLTDVGRVSALAIDPLTPTTLYAGTDTGVHKSTDSGMTWNPTGLITQLSSVSLGPTSVVGGNPSTGLVTLSVAAPAGGAVVMLGTSTNVASVPASVTVAAGATSAVFAVSTSPVTAPAAARISASYGGASSFADLTVTPATTLSSLSLNPTSGTGGAASIGTVTLSAAAPAGGAMVVLSCSNTTVATVPASVTVPAGAISAAFTISTNPVAASIAVSISATYSAVTKSANLTVNPAITLLSLSLNPASVTSGSTSSGTVTLSAAGPAGGAVVALSSSNTAGATVPTSATVAAGATSATFTVSTNSLTACASSAATISATYGDVTRSAGLTVTPATDTVAIQQADYFAYRHELRVAATSTGSTATLQVYVTSTGELIGTLTHYDGNRYNGRFTRPVNPQNVTLRSSFCGSATKTVTSK